MSPADEPKTKIHSLADLQAIKAKTQTQNALREDGYHVLATVHMGTCGIASGSRAVLAAMVDELNASGRLDVRVSTSGCIGVCEREPVMTIEALDQPKVIYGELTAEKARRIFHEHIMGGKLVPEYVVGYGDEKSSSQEA
jgi:NADP-reducing hydrogenase subunit HndB